ncbi:type I-E CRISPR-associated protein Cas6/Cse3/CasE [Zhihengliuella somnathii]
MTWFSTIDLNPERRQARRILTSGQVAHASVLNAFPPGTPVQDDTGRVLWRIDSSGREHRLYIVSPERPDLSALAEQAGWEAAPGRTADYSGLLDGLQLGQQWRFRFRGNPTKSIPQDNGRGKVVPHVTPVQQIDWLSARAEANGFAFVADSQGAPQVTVTGRNDASFRRDDPHANETGRVTLRQAQFDGVLEVTDIEQLRHALQFGIGRGKAYGCGLLTLRRS